MPGRNEMPFQQPYSERPATPRPSTVSEIETPIVHNEEDRAHELMHARNLEQLAGERGELTARDTIESFIGSIARYTVQEFVRDDDINVVGLNIEEFFDQLRNTGVLRRTNMLEDNLYESAMPQASTRRHLRNMVGGVEAVGDALVALGYTVRIWWNGQSDSTQTQVVALPDSLQEDVPPPPYTRRNPQATDVQDLRMLYESGRADLAYWVYHSQQMAEERQKMDRLSTYAEVDPLASLPRYPPQTRHIGVQTD